MKKTLVTLLVLTLAVLIPAAFAVDISSCQEINQSGSYTIINDLTASTSCLNVTANNVDIDGDGYDISGTGIGITISADDVSVTDLTLDSLSLGIFVNDSSSVDLDTLTLSSNNVGIQTMASDNVVIKDSDFSLNECYGIFLLSTDDSDVKDNTIEDTLGHASCSTPPFGTDGVGLYIKDSDNIDVFDNQIDDNDIGIFLHTTDNVQIIDGQGVGNDISLFGIAATNTYVERSTLIINGQDINMTSNSDLTLINSTIISKVVDPLSTTTEKTYIRFYVEDEAGNPIGVVNTYTSGTDASFVSDQTDSTGYTDYELYTYRINQGGVITTHNQTANATKTGYADNVTTFVADAQKTINIVIDDNAPIVFLTGTTPSLPLMANGMPAIDVSYISSELPLDFTFLLFNSSGDLVDTTTTTTGISPVTYTFGAIADGNYQLKVNATDDLGQGDVHTVGNVTIDNTNPTVNYVDNSTTPDNTLTNVPTIDVNITANDTYLLNTSIVLVNSTGGKKIVANTGSFSTQFTNLSDGTYTFYATAQDQAANTAKTANRTVTVDTTPPNITGINTNAAMPFTSNPNNFNNITFNYSSSEYPITVLYWIVHPNGTIVLNWTRSHNSAATIPENVNHSRVLPDALYVTSMNATDAAGNTAMFEVGNFTLTTPVAAAASTGAGGGGTGDLQLDVSVSNEVCAAEPFEVQVDGESGPAAGAIVTVSPGGESDTTNANGLAQLTIDDVGSYELHIVKSLYDSERETITVVDCSQPEEETTNEQETGTQTTDTQTTGTTTQPDPGFGIASPITGQAVADVSGFGALFGTSCPAFGIDYPRMLLCWPWWAGLLVLALIINTTIAVLIREKLRKKLGNVLQNEFRVAMAGSAVALLLGIVPFIGIPMNVIAALLIQLVLLYHLFKKYESLKHLKKLAKR